MTVGIYIQRCDSFLPYPPRRRKQQETGGNYYEKQQEQKDDNEVMITALNNIGDAFELYIKEPTQERKVFLMMNLKQVQMSLKF